MSYQAQARIVCRVFASEQSATLPGRTSPILSHAAFSPMSISERLFRLDPAVVGMVPDDDKAACLAKASDYVRNELPAVYSLDVDKAVPIPGHALIEGVWVRTGPQFVAYSFPLRRNNEPIEDECTFTDAAGKEQSLTLSWCVVVQPQ